MKSIKTKIMAILLICTLVCSLAIGGAAVLSSSKVVDKNTDQIMSLYCTNQAQQINSLLKRIERSVQTITNYAKEQLTEVELFQNNTKYVDSYTEKIKDVVINAAKHTDGAMAVYIRYNPDFTMPTSGLFYTLENNEFIENAPTDLSKYAASDTERVGWYHIPVQMKNPIWLKPYWNKNINVKMISYIIPIIINGVTVGVIGMDINFEVLSNIIDSTKIFKTGYAFLIDDKSCITYHPDYAEDTPLSQFGQDIENQFKMFSTEENAGTFIKYRYNDEERKAVSQQLQNGMLFVLSAPYKEIISTRTDLIIQLITITFFVSIITLWASYTLSAKIAKPLLELNDVAKKIAKGDLNITICHRSQDEIGILADSFRKTVGKLSEYISYINGLAYRDPMTGVKSKTAYLEAIENLNKEIHTRNPEFAVIVFDLNGLKQINDKFGHDMGDMIIITASKIICKVFSHSPVYRIGGDEFVVILSQRDLNVFEELLNNFTQELKRYKENASHEQSFTIARGIAIYNSETDLSYHDVFKRADAAMYKNKENLKANVEKD